MLLKLRTHPKSSLVLALVLVLMALTSVFAFVPRKEAQYDNYPAHARCARIAVDFIVDSVGNAMHDRQIATLGHPGTANIEWLIEAQRTERARLDSTARLLYQAADSVDASSIGCQDR